VFVWNIFPTNYTAIFIPEIKVLSSRNIHTARWIGKEGEEGGVVDASGASTVSTFRV
jgi:hypothetical protein